MIYLSICMIRICRICKNICYFFILGVYVFDVLILLDERNFFLVK